MKLREFFSTIDWRNSQFFCHSLAKFVFFHNCLTVHGNRGFNMWAIDEIHDFNPRAIDEIHGSNPRAIDEIHGFISWPFDETHDFFFSAIISWNTWFFFLHRLMKFTFFSAINWWDSHFFCDWLLKYFPPLNQLMKFAFFLLFFLKTIE